MLMPAPLSAQKTPRPVLLYQTHKKGHHLLCSQTDSDQWCLIFSACNFVVAADKKIKNIFMIAIFFSGWALNRQGSARVDESHDPAVSFTPVFSVI